MTARPTTNHQPPITDTSIYHAKLLLFGEHLLLTGAAALAVPVPAFYGQWKWADTSEPRRAQKHDLSDFAAYLLREGIIGTAFGDDLAKGLYFDSNIPEGYGLGSSGALCAAIFDRYGALNDQRPQNLTVLNDDGEGVSQKNYDLSRKTEKDTETLAVLKGIFAQMENFFHGSSSGIDPLTSYANRPLLIEQKTQASMPQMCTWENPPVIFLMDTRLPRQTGPLVQWYLQQYELPDFRFRLEQEMLPAHEQMLQAWLHADEAIFWPALQQVSAFQLEYFHPMVPATMRVLWQESLKQDDYTIKICGAGGGGFMLGFAREQNTIEQLRAQNNLNILLPFSERDK